MKVKYPDLAGVEFYSPTQLQVYQENPRSFYNQFVNVKEGGQPMPSATPLMFGGALHDTCLNYLLGNRVKGKDIDKKQMSSYFKRKYEKELNESTFTLEQKKEALKELPIGQIMSCLFYDKTQGMMPTYIEKRLDYYIDGILIANTLDLIFVKDEGYIQVADIEDLKSASKPYDKGKVFTTFQLRSYALAVEENLKIPVDKVRFRVITKDMKPKMITYELCLLALSGWQDDFREDVSIILKGIKAGIFPRKYDNMLLNWYPFVEQDWKYSNYYQKVDERTL